MYLPYSYNVAEVSFLPSHPVMNLLPLHVCNSVILWVLNTVEQIFKINIVPDSLFSFSIVKRCISAEENDRSGGSTLGNLAKHREPTARFPQITVYEAYPYLKPTAWAIGSAMLGHLRLYVEYKLANHYRVRDLDL